MTNPIRECRMISDGGLLTPCINCGKYPGMNGGYSPKPKLDFSQEPPERVQFFMETTNKNMPIIEKGIAIAKSESERRRWIRVHRKYLELKKALEEAQEFDTLV
jgi:hypothetical protein